MPIIDTLKLIGSVLDASAFMPPKQIFSILGSPRQLLPPYHMYSEYSFFDPRKTMRVIRYLEEVSLLPIPVPYGQIKGLPIPETLFLRETHRFTYPENSQPGDDNYPDEAWFFINGIATNLDMAKMNCQYLHELFKRRIVGIQNPTDSIMVDLLECAIGKRWQRSMRPAQMALNPISEALNNPDINRVILICHSQGTIIAANILRTLADDHGMTYVKPFENMKKLEIYAFANCADNMQYVDDLQSEMGRPVPYIESFANEKDLVARLGMLSPRKDLWGIQIDGDCYIRYNEWGHLLNAHYLNGFDTNRKDYAPFRLPSRNGATPRLFGYIDGSTPAAY